MTRRARLTDPETSWRAALSGSDEVDRSIRSLILAALNHYGPLTHDQLITTVKQVRPVSDSGVRTRCRELVDEGKVERVPDMVAKSRYGRASLLWRIAK